MRKIIYLLFAICLFGAPVFAQGTDEFDENVPEKQSKVKSSELIFKTEIAPNGQINAEGTIKTQAIASNIEFDNKGVYGDKVALGFTAEYFYYFHKNIGLGAGFKQLLNRKVNGFGDFSISNFYLALKPKIQLNPKTGEGEEYVYLIFQGGYGFFNNGMEIKDTYTNEIVPTENEDGLYYGGGIGFEFNNFIFEVIFTVNESKVKGKGHMLDVSSDAYPVLGSADLKYSMTTVNFGYKFDFNKK